MDSNRHYIRNDSKSGYRTRKEQFGCVESNSSRKVSLQKN
jgi:hypothetical protein